VSIDPDYVLAINSLAMTQKLTGEFEKAVANYEVAIKALARGVVQSWTNSVTNERTGHADSRNSLWTEYAAYAALWLAANEDSIRSISWPTGDLAERDARTRFLEGWYWQDVQDSSGQNTRFYCPNFFNTFHNHLLRGQIYNHLIGNRGIVLRELGQNADAEAHLQEAEDFSL
jgi:tetratricopeptide (TPR) repeat protein